MQSACPGKNRDGRFLCMFTNSRARRLTGVFERWFSLHLLKNAGHRPELQRGTASKVHYILEFSKGQMSVCCSYQVAIFQVALITLVRCAFLRNHTARFCTVILGIFAYCDSTILRSVRNLEQNAAGLGKVVANTFHELRVFQFRERARYAGNAASQIFWQMRKRIDYINATLCIDPVVLLRKSCPVKQQGIEQLCCVAQVCISSWWVSSNDGGLIWFWNSGSILSWLSFVIGKPSFLKSSLFSYAGLSAWCSCPFPAAFSGSLLRGHCRVSHADGHVIFKVRWRLVESISQSNKCF